MDGQEVVSAFNGGLADDDARVRYFPVRGRWVAECEESVEALEDVVKKEKFNHVQIAAPDEVGQIGGQRIAGIVSGLVRDDDPDGACGPPRVGTERTRGVTVRNMASITEPGITRGDEHAD